MPALPALLVVILPLLMTVVLVAAAVTLTPCVEADEDPDKGMVEVEIVIEPVAVTVRRSLLLTDLIVGSDNVVLEAVPLVSVLASLTVKSTARASNAGVNICAASRARAQRGIMEFGLFITV